jgi:Flp pilus assembly protein protease CpaA
VAACTGHICVCCAVCCVSALLCVLGVPFLGNALLARRGLAPGETAGRSPLVAGAAACARGFSALAYGVLLAAAGVGWPAYALCILSFLVLHVAVYCDCTARIIPTEATLVLVCCGVCLCMAQEGPPLLLERALLAAPLLGALCLCNFTSCRRSAAPAFGGGDLKTLPALALFGNAAALLDGVLACSLFTACAGLGLALARRRLRGVHVPLAPGMLVCLCTTTLGS